MSGPENLRWCPGCQTNVKAKVSVPGGPECPQCGYLFGSSQAQEDVGRQLSRHIGPEVDPDDLEIEPQIDADSIQVESDGLKINLPSADLTKTVRTGRLTLNPKVADDAIVPVCPECEEPIERAEGSGAVEFRCGCDELRYFEFPERGGDG